jgi:glycosyltransferase involved in cell wall biosynthesis
MNILYTSADLGVPLRGTKGAGVHVRAITQALSRLGHKVTIAIATERSGNPAPDVHRIEVLTAGAVAARAQLMELIEREQIEFVIERYSLNSGAAVSAAHACGLALLLEVNAPLVHEAARYRGLNNVPAALEQEREVFESADVISVVSTPLQRYVRSIVPAADIHVVPNGVEVARFATAQQAPLPVAAGRPVVGFAGSMKAWHGVLDLLEAFSRCARREPAPLLLLVGSGPEEDAVRRRAGTRELVGDVMLAGAVAHAEMPQLLAAIDIAVAPYTPSDNFYFCPLKILEYMAAGKPVVYPEVGDLPSIVDDAGIGYPAGDIDAMASALGHLLDDSDHRDRLGAAATTRAAAYDWRHTAAALVALAPTGAWSAGVG